MTDEELMSQDQKAAAVAVVECLLPVMAAEEIEAWSRTRLRRLDGERPCELILAGAGDRALEVARAVGDPRRAGVSTDRRIA